MEFKVRRTERSDIPFIKALLSSQEKGEVTQSSLNKRFGSIDIDDLSSHSVFSLTITGVAESEILGICIISPFYPKHLGPIENLDWSDYLRSTYGCPQVQLNNSAILAFFYCSQTLENQSLVLHVVLQNIYCNIADLNNLVFLMPDNMLLFQPLSSAIEGNSKAQYFQEVKSIKESCKHSLYISQRQDILPPLLIRPAKVEDIDDLVPLFSVHGAKLVEKFDDFNLSQLIETGQDIRKTLVAETFGRVVGFISLTLDTNFQSVSSNFDIDFLPGINNDGVINGFYITIFCMDNDYLGQSYEFIKAAFEEYAEKQYCLISIPNSSDCISLLKYFQKIPARTSKFPKHSLYILSRRGWFERSKVRLAEAIDQIRLREFLQLYELEGEIPDLAMEAENPHPSFSHFVSFIAEVGKEIVAFVQVEIFQDDTSCTSINHPFNFYRNFDIEIYSILASDGIKINHGKLNQIQLNPLFSVQAGWIFKEICRILELTAIFSVKTPESAEYTRDDYIIRRFFQFIRPLRSIEYPKSVSSKFSSMEKPKFCVMLFSLEHSEEWKVDINFSIVVVGGSTTGLSLLEQLVYQTHLNFNHLFLITPDDFPPQLDYLLPGDIDYSSVDFAQLGLERKATVIQGSLVEIDRDSKKIKTTFLSDIRYDYLILATRAQFSASAISESFNDIHGVESVVPQSIQLTLSRVKEASSHKQELVIFGSILPALNIMHGVLVEHSLDPSLITVIIVDDGSSILEKSLASRILSEVDKVGVHVIENAKNITSWEKNERGLQQITVEFVNGHKKSISCNHLLYCDKKLVDADTFRAISDAHLIFDEKLVIDEYFQTNDPYIYAAGPMTKFASKYCSNWNSEHYNSKEVGQRLSQRILGLMDFTGLSENTNQGASKYFLPVSVQLNVLYDHKLVHFDRPNIRKLYGQKLSREGREIVTNTSYSYTRIFIDSNGWIESMTVYSKSENIQSKNLIALYGCHEQVLNNLLKRYDENLISDLLMFLQEPWAAPIYHPKFSNFMDSLRKEIIDRSSEENDVIVQLRELVAKGENMNDAERDAQYKKWEKGSYFPIIKERVTEFFNRSV